MHLQKYRTLSAAVQNTEERAETAENSLQKIRSKAKRESESSEPPAH